MSDLTPERLAELRRIAEAATPGPWEVVGLSGYGVPYALRMPHRSGHTWYGVEGIKRREDAEYFVACDPDTIRALLEEIERLAEELAALKAENERLREALKDADNELDWLDEDIGIGCDHSAGVCTCDYWNMRRKMKAALSKETNHD